MTISVGELKPCPFCGADGGVYYHGEDFSGSSQVDVGCTGGCHISPRAVGDTMPDSEQDEAWAIKEWNTRTNNHDSLLSAAKEALEDLETWHGESLVTQNRTSGGLEYGSCVVEGCSSCEVISKLRTAITEAKKQSS